MNKLQSSGGPSPEQTALAQYTYGQNLLANRAAFAGGTSGGGGPGLSTMSTQASGGARNALAQQLASASDQNAQLQQQAGSQLQQLSNQQQGQQGFAAATSGSFGSTPDTTAT
jgi:hypothetical protein